jgi:hypothetical protein
VAASLAHGLNRLTKKEVDVQKAGAAKPGQRGAYLKVWAGR